MNTKNEVKQVGHTPGPWQWEKANSWFHLQGPAGGLGISTGKNLYANHYLIAAAPELLEACKAMLQYMTDPESTDELAHKAMALAKIAISKAESNHE